MATTTTPNIALEKKDYGDTGWDAMINGNSDKTDAAITSDRNRLNLIESEITAARGGFTNIDARSDQITSRVASVEAEIFAGRGGAASLDARADAQDAEIADLQALVAGMATLSELGVTISEYVDAKVEDLNLSALSAVVDQNRSDIGAIDKEVMRQRDSEEAIQEMDDLQSLFVDHIASNQTSLDKQIAAQSARTQSGSVVIYNRGKVSGAAVTKGALGTYSVASGVIFGLGRTWPINAQDVAISANSSGATVTRRLYLTLPTGGSYPILTCTADGESTPSTGLELGFLTIPVGSDASWWSSITFSGTIRTESEWPIIATSPPFANVTPKYEQGGTNYRISVSAADYAGGEPPRIEAPIANRATNTFRVYIFGIADAVTVDWTTHISNI
jgi:hypothetical protein